MNLNFNFKGKNSEVVKDDVHFINGRPLKGPYPSGLGTAMFGMGCFWGVEKAFWSLDGVWVTAVGYSAGKTLNPTYQEVCSGKTDHNEVVFLKFNPEITSYGNLLKIFWEGHDPTQGNRQGNDVGSQYRSGIYTFNSDQNEDAMVSKQKYSQRLVSNGFEPITTEIKKAEEFFYAEGYHQQYLAKNPQGYCGLGGTGIAF